MTVIFSKKCEIGLQSVLFLSTLEENETVNSNVISKKVKQPKEFVSKVLQILTKSGIVGSHKGKKGGFFLAKPANKIRLIEIVLAIDGNEIFNNCVLGFPGCSDDHPCPVHNTWGKLRDEAYKMLNSQSLAELRESTKEKITSL